MDERDADFYRRKADAHIVIESLRGKGALTMTEARSCNRLSRRTRYG